MAPPSLGSPVPCSSFGFSATHSGYTFMYPIPFRLQSAIPLEKKPLALLHQALFPVSKIVKFTEEHFRCPATWVIEHLKGSDRKDTASPHAMQHSRRVTAQGTSPWTMQWNIISQGPIRETQYRATAWNWALTEMLTPGTFQEILEYHFSKQTRSGIWKILHSL